MPFLSQNRQEQIEKPLLHRIEQTSQEMGWELPKLTFNSINGTDLFQIQSDVSNILRNRDSFILDITCGRKIMAIGATLAYVKSNAEAKLLSYYLSRQLGTNEATDRLIQYLMDDEWSLTYYESPET